MSLPFLSFIVPIFSWNIPLVSPICLKRTVVLPTLLFSSISLHYSLKKAFLFILVIIWSHGPQPCLTQWNYKPCHVGPPKMDVSWWRVLTKHGPLDKEMANHFSIFALRTPWTVWKDKKIGLKDELPRLMGAQCATGDQWRNNSRKNEGMEPKQKQHPVVDVTGNGSEVWCFKE